MGWILLAILCLAGIVALSVLKSKNDAKIVRMRLNAAKSDDYTEAQAEALIAAEEFPVPGFVKNGLILATVVFVALGGFNKFFFYAEPGYKYHVRTLYPATESMVDTVGYSYYGMGQYNKWKKAMTVQAKGMVGNEDSLSAETEGGANTSASLSPLNITFLDQVDANAEATVRFRLPVDQETFLELAQEYRSPENFLRTALIPAFRETLQASASLMTAEAYYSGARTTFNSEFENQMRDGIYLVTRKEVLVDDDVVANASANASKGEQQDAYGDGKKTILEVKKEVDATGAYKRKAQNFTNFGVSVVEARITEMKPNAKFKDRMQLKQQASADRAIAREQRIQEEEQKLLAIATGERQVAEKQAEAKVNQIEQTTNAETEKQLALTEASKKLEYAKVEEQTAIVNLKRDTTTAKSVKVLADAEAYKKEAILKADNALAQKMDTEVKIQKVWAAAYANRAVPQMVFGNSGGGGAPVGSDSETADFMKLMTLQAAKSLNYDRTVTPAK